MATCNLYVRISLRRGCRQILLAINTPLVALGIEPIVPRWMFRTELIKHAVD